MTLREFHLARMQEAGIEPKKSLGQNFLINERVVSAILAAFQHFKPKAIIEIGPGTGVLTERLLELGLPYQAIEMDYKLSAYWRERKIDLIETDALKVDWQNLNLASDTCLVSNLPYQIAARIVVEMCMGPQNINHMVLMFQKEVAQRIAAEHKTEEYGFLSVLSALAFDLRKEADAGPGDFFPPPKVASRVLQFSRKATLPQEFIDFVKLLFVNRRKYLVKQLPEPKAALIEGLVQLGYNEKVRAEEVRPAHYLDLFRIYKGNV